MYQARVNNAVLPDESTVPTAVDEAMWKLFVATGEFGKLGDDPQTYRLRLRAFMSNRIRFSPIYRDFYVLARTVIDGLIAQTGDKSKACELLSRRSRGSLPPRPRKRSWSSFNNMSRTSSSACAYRLAASRLSARSI